ncbi:MAG: TolC family protein, partial [candidate division WOR-3 bacterium]
DIQFPTLDSLIQVAQSQRPDIIIEHYNKKILEAQHIQARSNYLPTLSLSSSYNLSGQEFLEQSASWSAGVNFSLPIFNGFSTLARVKQARIALQQAELKINSLQNNIIAEVSQAYANWQLAKKNLEVSQKTLQAARAAYQLTKLQYEQGRTSYYFVQQKESELTQAENANVNALYNLYTASAVLEKVIGRSN